MKVRELMTILQDYHPDEDVGLQSSSNRNMTFLGVNQSLTEELGHLVLSVDFTRNNKPVETAKDILLRQEEDIKKAIERIDREEMRAAAATVRRKAKKKRTGAQMLLDGYILDGRKGRPKKILTEEEIAAKLAGTGRKPGRPRKENPENNQESNQPQ